MKKRIQNIAFLLATFVLVGFMPADSLEQGKKNMRAKNYFLAIEHYEVALEEARGAGNTTMSMQIMEQLALAHLNVKHYLKSEWYFDQVLNETTANPEVLLGYANLQQIQEKYDRSIWYYWHWGEVTGQAEQANEYIRFCNISKSQHSDKSMVEVSKLGLSTSEYAEFSPVIHPSGKLVYTSDRPSETNPTTDHTYGNPTSLFEQDVSISEGGCGSSMPLLSKENHVYNNGSACFTNDGNTIYYTANVIQPGKLFSREETQYTLGIFKSTYDGHRWSKGVLQPMCAQGFNFAFPTLSADGNTMIYSSDAYGGQGEMDLYKSVRNSEGWSKPINLGSEINTSGNDVYPFIYDNGDDQILYFSSDGRPGYGGLDIYVWEMTSDDVESTIGIVQAPINSNYDDFGYVSSRSNTFGYFSSNRNGSDDIFYFKDTDLDSYVPRLEDMDAVADPLEEEEIAEMEVSAEDEQSEITSDTAEETEEQMEEEVQETESEPIEREELIPEVNPTPIPTPVNVIEPLPKEKTPKEVVTHSMEYLNDSELNGFYMVVYSAHNGLNLANHRNTHFPDAILIKNSNGFHHIAYVLSNDEKTALKEFKSRRKKHDKAWLYRP